MSDYTFCNDCSIIIGKGTGYCGSCQIKFKERMKGLSDELDNFEFDTSEFTNLSSYDSEPSKEEAALEVAIVALRDIRKFSLGSKADTCDEAFKEIEKILGKRI